MKYFGSKFEYEKERNEDLMRAYRQQIESCDYIHSPSIFRSLVKMPAKRFWVSEERAAIVMANIRNGDKLLNMRSTKREMFFEIYNRVMELRKANPNMSLYELTFNVVKQPAPEFYLTPGSAKVIFYKIKKKWYLNRMQKLSLSL